MPQQILRMELLKQQIFWVAHLWNVTKGPLGGGDVEIDYENFFGISAEGVEAFYLKELGNEREWPVFHIPLASGYSIEVEYTNEPEDHQITYRLCHIDWDKAICVGISGGGWQLPAFRWIELLKISSLAGRTNSSNLFFLLLPTVWLTEDDDLNEVNRYLSDELMRMEIVSHNQASILSKHLIDHCKSDILWHYDEQFGWINAGENCSRNPNSNVSLSNIEFSNLATFMSLLDE